jgi:hypothetical protein
MLTGILTKPRMMAHSPPLFSFTVPRDCSSTSTILRLGQGT